MFIYHSHHVTGTVCVSLLRRRPTYQPTSRSRRMSINSTQCLRRGFVCGRPVRLQEARAT
jgi:hypothetical protein